jgi:hypothetical protein
MNNNNNNNNKTINQFKNGQVETEVHFLKDIPVRRQMYSGFPLLRIK